MRGRTGSQIRDCMRQWWLKILFCCDKEAEEDRKPIQIGSPYNFRHEGGANGTMSSSFPSNTTSTYLIPRAAPPANGSSISQIPSEAPIRPPRTDIELPSATASTQASSLADITTNSVTGDWDEDSITLNGTDYSKEEVKAAEV